MARREGEGEGEGEGDWSCWGGFMGEILLCNVPMPRSVGFPPSAEYREEKQDGSTGCVLYFNERWDTGASVRRSTLRRGRVGLPPAPRRLRANSRLPGCIRDPHRE